MSYGNSIGTASINVPRSIKRARQSPEVKMKKTLKQRIREWLYNDEAEKGYATMEPDSISSNGMRFNLYVAKGGYVVEIRKYDDRNDRHHNQLYVFADEANLGEELSKIITMEAMR